VRAESLGLLELGAVPALPEAVELATRFGLDLSAHRARELSQADLAHCDLVLGFEQIHVSAAVVDGRAPIGQTFTLPELVALLEKVPPVPSAGEGIEGARTRIEEADALRRSGPRRRSVEEIPDPLGRPPAVQRRIAEEIRLLVSELAARLFG
jgi:protein-tyrosine-phosphatase